MTKPVIGFKCCHEGPNRTNVYRIKTSFVEGDGDEYHQNTEYVEDTKLREIIAAINFALNFETEQVCYDLPDGVEEELEACGDIIGYWPTTGGDLYYDLDYYGVDPANAFEVYWYDATGVEHEMNIVRG